MGAKLKSSLTPSNANPGPGAYKQGGTNKGPKYGFGSGQKLA